MATASHGAKPSPERIFATLTAFQQTEALKAAIQLDIFTKIGEGANDASSLAKAIGASERGVRILCDYMTIFGFLSKENNRYGLTQDSAVFLDRRSPAYMGAMSNFLASDMHRKSFGALAEAVRKGGSAVPDGDNTRPRDDFWVEFARSMGGLALPGAEFIAALIGAEEKKPCKVLDIAAGHGMYGITIARRILTRRLLPWIGPRCWSGERKRQAAGVAERCARGGKRVRGRLREGYDYVLLTNIFHHFDPAGCEKLMRRVHAALKPGGKAITWSLCPMKTAFRRRFRRRLVW